MAKSKRRRLSPPQINYFVRATTLPEHAGPSLSKNTRYTSGNTRDLISGKTSVYATPASPRKCKRGDDNNFLHCLDDRPRLRPDAIINDLEYMEYLTEIQLDNLSVP
jgi:hypothetical protein